MAGQPGRSGRRPSDATVAIRGIVNDPECFRIVEERAKQDPVFWFQLYQQIHGRPPQAIELSGPARGPIVYRADFPDEAASHAPTNGHAHPAAAALLSAAVRGGQEA